MKTLVLGGTRFVGLRLVRELARQGHEITILNRGKTHAQLAEGIKRLYADRRDAQAVREALSGTHFDWVFDCTGYQTGNLEPLVELFQGLVQRYVFVSTSGVYKRSELMPISEDFPLQNSETTEKGLTAYGAEKVQCEEFLLQAHAKHGFPTTIVRPAIIYGPHNWMDDREGSYFARLLMGRKVLVPSDGTALMHIVHVDDLARLLITTAENDRAVGQAYNAAGPHAITIKGWMELVTQVVGVEAQEVHLPEVVLAEATAAGRSPLFFTPWDRSEVYSTQKARDDLSFVPQYDLEDGLRHTYEWWRAERGLEKIELTPGRLGHNVDLPYEDELIQRYG